MKYDLVSVLSLYLSHSNIQSVKVISNVITSFIKYIVRFTCENEINRIHGLLRYILKVALYIHIAQGSLNQ